MKDEIQNRDCVDDLIRAFDILSKRLNKKEFTFSSSPRKFKIQEFQ